MNEIKKLEVKIHQIENKMKPLEEMMAKLADYATPGYLGKDKKEKSELYYKIKKHRDDLVQKRNVYIWRIARICNT